ncbi:ABC transporter permease [Hungatella hathewayi]
MICQTNGFWVDGRKISVSGIDEQAFRSMFLSEISEGRFPETVYEVVLSEYAKSLLKVDIGDTIQIDGINEPLVISGFAENSAKQMRQDTFSALLSMNGFRTHIPAENYTEQLVVQLSPFCNMQKVIADIADQLHLSEKQVIQNGNLLAVLGQSDNNFIIQLYGCAVILFLLVLIASVLMITSSLNSNVMQRTEFFGMLRCVGATRKQIMKFVRREGLRWCKFAIPIGLICGIVVVWGLCAALKFISPEYFAELPVFRVSWISILCGIIIGFLTVLLAAQAPAKKAASVSPLTAVSGNAFSRQSVKTRASEAIR